MCLFAAVARNGFCFTVSPQVVDVVLVPEDEYAGEFIISNNGPNSVLINVTLEEFCVSETPATKAKGPYKGWINVSPLQISVPPYGSGRCGFKIKLPREAKGEYRVYAFFQNITQAVSGEQIKFSTRLGNIICVVAKNTEIVRGGIKKIQLAGSKPGRWWVTVYNEGNVHIRPKGEVVVKNRITGREFSIPFNLKGVSVLPSEEEEYVADGDVNLEPGIYSVTAKSTCGEEYGDKAIELIKRNFFKINY